MGIWANQNMSIYRLYNNCCYLQKKKKPEKKTAIATYDIPTPKGQKKGEETLNGQN